VDNQCFGNETNSESIQYDFVSKLAMFLKNQGFVCISHDLKKATRETKVRIADYTQPLPVITPVHCENCLDWAERYYKDIPYLQAQLKHLTTRNSLLERENQELKACVQSKANL
jgi:hypothetical protein